MLEAEADAFPRGLENTWRKSAQLRQGRRIGRDRRECSDQESDVDLRPVLLPAVDLGVNLGNDTRPFGRERRERKVDRLERAAAGVDAYEYLCDLLVAERAEDLEVVLVFPDSTNVGE